MNGFFVRDPEHCCGTQGLVEFGSATIGVLISEDDGMGWAEV